MAGPSLDVKFTSKQTRALKSEATEILYGGAAGGGKSFFMRVLACILCGLVPGLQVYLFRRIREDLVKNHMEGPRSFPVLLAAFVVARMVTIVEDEIRFWNGSKIFLCHCKDEKDKLKYLGAEIHVLLMDELTTFTESMYRFLRNRVRAPGLVIPPSAILIAATFGIKLREKIPLIICGSNPGGIGHQWVKQAFVDSARPFEVRQMSDEEGGMLRAYIPAKLEDNPQLMVDDPGYEKRLMGLGSKELVKAYRHGDWNIVAGAYLDNIREDKHKLPGFTPPKHWTRFRSMDWGSAKPFSVGWWVIAEAEWVKFRDGSERMLPAGALVRYREWYGVKRDEDGRPKPDQGLRLTAEAVGRGIMEREAGEKIDEQLSVADPAMWKEDGGPSVAEKMLKCDPKRPNEMIGPRFKPADNTRVVGWQQVHARLQFEGMEFEQPMLYVTEDCQDWWRTVPALQHDETKPEDIDTRQEDHCFAAGTMVSTSGGMVAIDMLPESGVVDTPCGPMAYRSARMTRRDATVVRLEFDDGSSVVCTPDHRFSVAGEWRHACDLLGVEVDCITKRLRCVGVSDAGSADVYCLTVPGVGAFNLANGAVVSNCGDDSRYACQSRPISRVPKPRQITGPKPWTLDWVMQQGNRKAE